MLFEQSLFFGRKTLVRPMRSSRRGWWLKDSSRKKGIDYEETFSGVVDKVSLRSVFHLIASNDMRCIKFDVPTAFLHAQLEEEIYISLPREVFDYPKRSTFSDSEKPCIALTQSPRACKPAHGHLATIGFSPSEKDPMRICTLEGGDARRDLRDSR
jgi:hypothetical protein